MVRCRPIVTRRSCCAPTNWARPTGSSRCSPAGTGRSGPWLGGCGARRRIFGARLELFSHVDLQFATGRTLDVITQAVTLHPYSEPLSHDYERYTTGQVMIETADRLVVEEREPALQQYQLLVGALHALTTVTTDGPRPPVMVMDAYLLRAVALAGYAPTLADCARCGGAGPHDGVLAPVGRHGVPALPAAGLNPSRRGDGRLSGRPAGRELAPDPGRGRVDGAAGERFGGRLPGLAPRPWPSVPESRRPVPLRRLTALRGGGLWPPVGCCRYRTVIWRCFPPLHDTGNIPSSRQCCR